MFEFVTYLGWIVFAVVSVVGCGGRAERNNSHPNEADSGTFSCGDAICGPMQICVYPPACLGFPPPDGGTCPTDTTYSPDAGACLAINPRHLGLLRGRRRCELHSSRSANPYWL
jgi:hypothetical protein